ncbi:MAG: alpha/beta hydrolase [Caldilineaceae bacterium]|nr:alpha/beta hydrolase [Caldilineaceae bacterium]
MKLLKRLLVSMVGLIGVLLFAVVGLFVGTAGDHSVPDTVTTDPTLPHVEIDGVTFHAETFGSPQNPVVVVVHGGPGGDYGYLLNLHQLEDEYFVVFYDQRGAGLSPRVDAAELSLQSSIEDLHRIVTHYGQGKPVHLIGHSWGGMLAAGYLGQYPKFVTKAVLAEPGALDNMTLARFHERQRASRGFEYVRTLIPTIFETFHMTLPDADARTDYIFGRMSQAFVGSSASSYRCADETVTEVAPAVPVPPSRFGATAFNTIFGEQADLSAIAASAANYPKEVLFIASACNTFIGEEFQRAQMTLFPNTRLTVIPDAGHNMIAENPAGTLEAIRTYFAS